VLALAAHSGIPTVDVPSIPESIYLMLSVIFLQASVEFPEPLYLEVFFFVMPVIGLALLSSGVASVSVLLFNKSARGREWEAALASTFSNHVIVVGLGKLGYLIVQQLLDFGQAVVAVGSSRTSRSSRWCASWACRDHLRRATAIRSSRPTSSAPRRSYAARKTISRTSTSRWTRASSGPASKSCACSTPTWRPGRARFRHSPCSARPAWLRRLRGSGGARHVEYSFYVDDQLLHVARVAVEPDSPLAGQTIEQVERRHDRRSFCMAGQTKSIFTRGRTRR
jgi:hypothetical protein